MKVALFVTLSAIHLTAAVSRATENVLSQAESSSTASEVERNTSRSYDSEDCISRLWLCIKSTKIICLNSVEQCHMRSLDCYHSHRMCKAAENAPESVLPDAESTSSVSEVELSISKSNNPTGRESDESETEPISSALKDQHSANIFENTADCDRKLKLCSDSTWGRCDIMTMACPSPSYCRHSYDQCKAAIAGGSAESEPESVSSELEVQHIATISGNIAAPESVLPDAESISSASEVKLSISKSNNLKECKAQLNQCLAKAWRSCTGLVGSCLITPSKCYLLHAACQFATTVKEGDHSKANSSTRAFEVERGASNFKNLADCDRKLKLCSGRTLGGCDIFRIACPSPSNCRHSHDKCKAAIVREIAESEPESISSGYEVQHNATISGNITVEGSDQSETESSTKAFKMEHDDVGSENPTDCDNQKALCLDKALKDRHLGKKRSKITPQVCDRSYKHCKAARESARSAVESNSNASDVDYSASGIEKPAECDNQLERCLVTVWIVCDSVPILCPITSFDCHRFYDLCMGAEVAAKRARLEEEARSSASEVERDASSTKNSTDCVDHHQLCLVSEWMNCGSEEFPCDLNPEHCFRAYLRCMQGEDGTESAPSEVESSSSSSEVPQIDLKECDSRLERCLDTAWDRCESSIMPCSLTVHLCYQSYDLCKAGESECDGLHERCLDTAWIVCGSAAIPCMITSTDCYRSYDLCKCAENGTQCAWPEVESSSIASEIERYANSYENPAGDETS